ncbi:MAG TPA: hypothetical protein P5075_04075 [Eubacteriales bacterium]|nr:hypothetical protein [Eubacteriales bacterium]
MRKYPSRMGVGSSSILLIIVVVSLTLFAVLSLVQAKSDAALTDKTAASVDAFYDADARAQKMLAQIDGALAAGDDPVGVEGVTKVSDGTYEFSVGAYDGHTLKIVVAADAGRCIVTRYRYESASEWLSESGETLWQGD